jgi:hypothetical protein
MVQVSCEDSFQGNDVLVMGKKRLDSRYNGNDGKFSPDILLPHKLPAP